MEVVSSPHMAELDELKPGVNHLDRQQEDCFLLEAFTRSGRDHSFLCR